MSFESGAISARMFFLQEPLPENAVELFAQHCSPGLQALSVPGCTSFSGWVSGRHLLDRNITAETAMLGGYIHLTYMTAEKKVNDSLLKTESKLEMLAASKAKGANLNRKEKAEIQREVKARLLDSAQPTLRGMAMAYKPGSRILFAEAITDKQLDTFAMAMKTAVNCVPIACNAFSAAQIRKHIDVRIFDGANFSGAGGDLSSVSLDFMTWLWFCVETKGIVSPIKDMVVFMDAPLVLVGEGNGAHECILKKGTAVLSAEAKAALVVGKKLRSAFLLAARGKETWKSTFDAETWTVSSLGLPEKSAQDAAENFQQRMIALVEFHEAVLLLYEQFLSLRASDKWGNVISEISSWIQNRVGK